MVGRNRLSLLLAGAVLLAAGGAGAAERWITVASTTSTVNSGLLDYLLPAFTAETGIEVRVLALGTGQAIAAARRGDADVLLVHHKASEEQFVRDGQGVARFDVMYNDFVLVGPREDPAEVGESGSVTEALRRIAQARAPFVSRGDDSGTHRRELSLWKKAGLDPAGFDSAWYREAGAGMGAALNMASAMDAYILSDRATWLNFGNKGGLEILFQGDPLLFNQYGVILVNPEKHPHVKAKAGQAFIDWLLSPETQRRIAAYRINGRQAFFPNAERPIRPPPGSPGL